MSSSPPLLPWGRLVLISTGDRSSVPDHFDLSRSQHCIGRVANRCDLHIPNTNVSSLHSIIRLKGKDSHGEPVVEIEDLSRCGTWVDHVKVGYRKKATLKKGGVVHFVDPDARDMTTIGYRLEILPSGLTDQNEDIHAQISADEMSVAIRTRKWTRKETPVPLSTAAGKRRCRPGVPTASDNTVADLKNKYGTIILNQEVELQDKSVQLKKEEQELDTLRKENEALKKKHEEELAKINAEAETELKKVKADAAKQEEKSNKALSELRQERDGLKGAIQHILADPNAPHQVRSVVELEAKMLELKRELQANQDELDLQSHYGRPQTYVPAAVSDPSSLSDSSQSQDSLDSGRIRSARRDSQLSAASNERSEPSPGDRLQTFDEETKSGDASPPLFNIYGANPSPAGGNVPATLSQSQFLRPVVGIAAIENEESKTQQDEAKDETS